MKWLVKRNWQKSKVKGLDVERTKRSCRDFRNHQQLLSTLLKAHALRAKKQKTNSPFSYLLKPKAGGIAFALEVLGEQFDALLNTDYLSRRG